MSPREREGQLLSGEAVVAVDGAHRIMGANRAALQLMAGELVVGEVLRFTGFLEGPDLALAQSALDAALGQGEPSNQIQAQARDAAGQDFTCEYSINPLFGPGRQVVGAMINLRDLDPIEELANNGRDARTVLRNIQLFQKLAKEYGVELSWTKKPAKTNPAAVIGESDA